MVYTLRFFLFISLTYLVPVLFTFYIQGVLKLKNNSGAEMLSTLCRLYPHLTIYRDELIMEVTLVIAYLIFAPLYGETTFI
jgi:hypothetical protein